MSKVLVLYWSGTGNTEKMAEFVEQGAKSAGAEVSRITCSDFDKTSLGDYSGIALGCPSMGAEILEEDEFQPVFDSIKNDLSGKKVALFGSSGWGDGEWMRNWEEECRGLGISLACDYVIANEEPDDEAKDKCTALGAAIS